MKIGRIFTEKFITNMIESRIKKKKVDNEIKPEYDFSKGIRGKYCPDCLPKQIDRFNYESPAIEKETE